jgi:hypothetical protein
MARLKRDAALVGTGLDSAQGHLCSFVYNGQWPAFFVDLVGWKHG